MKVILQDNYFDRLTVNKERGEVFKLTYSETENTPGDRVDVYRLYYKFIKGCKYYNDNECSAVVTYDIDWIGDRFFRCCLHVRELLQRLQGVDCMLAIGDGEVGDYQMLKKEWWVFKVLEVERVGEWGEVGELGKNETMCEVSMKLRRV